MNIEIEIYLNQLAQGVKPIDNAKEWFSGLKSNDQFKVLCTQSYFIRQLGVVGEDATFAIRKSCLKESYTPCQLLLKAEEKEPKGSGEMRNYLGKIVNLPPHERIKSFVLLIALMGLTDVKRREWDFDTERH
jgi:hypothetical protein